MLVGLPGIGRYTAGAVSSFAYSVTPAARPSVARVFRRAFHPRLAKEGRTRPLWAIGAALLRHHGKRAWEFNQAMHGARCVGLHGPRRAMPSMSGADSLQGPGGISSHGSGLAGAAAVRGHATKERQ